MNYPDAKREAKRVFPQLKPTRPGSFTLLGDRTPHTLLVAGYDEKVTMLFNIEKDLWRLKGMVDWALGLNPLDPRVREQQLRERQRG